MNHAFERCYHAGRFSFRHCFNRVFLRIFFGAFVLAAASDVMAQTSLVEQLLQQIADQQAITAQLLANQYQMLDYQYQMLDAGQLYVKGSVAVSNDVSVWNKQDNALWVRPDTNIPWEVTGEVSIRPGGTPLEVEGDWWSDDYEHEAQDVFDGASEAAYADQYGAIYSESADQSSRAAIEAKVDLIEDDIQGGQAAVEGSITDYQADAEVWSGGGIELVTAPAVDVRIDTWDALRNAFDVELPFPEFIPLIPAFSLGSFSFPQYDFDTAPLVPILPRIRQGVRVFYWILLSLSIWGLGMMVLRSTRIIS